MCYLERRGSVLDTSLFEQDARDLDDDNVSLQLNNTGYSCFVQIHHFFRPERLLLPEMISPVSNRSHSVHEVQVQADVHTPPKVDIVE